MPEPRRRPAAGAWSPLEYVCHMRDVLRVQGERVLLAPAEDEPVFAPMGREERVVEEACNEQDPSVVLAELAKAADQPAGIFAGLPTGRWARTGVYNRPVTESRTLLRPGRHTIHEVEHHPMDVRRGTGQALGLP